MPPPGRYLATGLLAVAAAGGATAVAPFESEGSEEAGAETATAFADPDIDESSGLVVRRGRLFTVNDSGDGPYVYAVDPRSGETVGVSVFDDEDPVDVEALAPGSRGRLWVGDIGDNRRSRGSVVVHRFVPRDGSVDAASFELTYPDGSHDAEALLVHPRTGRLLVVTKRLVGGGVVYRAPRRLVAGGTHELERVARVPGMVTDGTFLAAGDRVLLRSYGAAAVYTYPGFEPTHSFELPVQEQGEAVAVGPDGRVYLSSEGEHAEVLVTDLPPPAPAGATPTRVPTPERDSRPGPGRGYDPQPWFGIGPWRVLLLAAAAAGSLLGVRAVRRRGRRRR